MNLDLFADLEPEIEVRPADKPVAPRAEQTAVLRVAADAQSASLESDVEAEVEAESTDQPVAQQKATLQVAAYAQRFGAAAREWGRSTVEDLAAASDAKTRLKNLKADEGAYARLVDACVFVAWRKREAYRQAFEGKDLAPFEGWLLQNPDLAHATERVTRAHLALNELPMLPAQLCPAAD